MTIKIFSKPACPFCDMAKNYLRQNGFEFQEIDISQDVQARDFIASQGHRTVPQIYFEDRCFVPGGWQGLKDLSRDDIEQRLQQFREEIAQ